MKEQKSPEWFEARKNRLTASVVGAVLDEAPYMTRDEVMRMMVREYHDAPKEWHGNVATEYGNANEDGARWQYELETGNEVKPAFFDTYEDWLGASADGYIEHDGLIEIKCPYSKKIKSIKDQPHYYSQIQVQLLCTGREWCHFYTFTPEKSNLETVEWDQEWHDKNMPVLRQFYAEYLHEREHDYERHLEPLRKEINTAEACKLIAEYDDMCEAEDRARERKKEIIDRLAVIADNKSALIDGRKFTKVEKQGAVSYAKAVKDLLPDADLEKYRGAGSEYWKLT